MDHARPRHLPSVIRRWPAVVAALLALAAAVPSPALARGGGRPEVRVSGTCGKGASSKIKLKADDGAIEVEFEVEHSRTRGMWNVVLVHERRVEWRGRARARAPRGSLSLERRVRDLIGADRVMVRAVGPRGITCSASATLPG
jgi:hypothetical protein